MSAIIYPVKILLGILTSLTSAVSYVAVVISCVLGVLQKVGMFEKILKRVAERHLSKDVNNARVTIGSLDVDILAGKVTVKDLIVHTPARDEWCWGKVFSKWLLSLLIY